MKLLRWFFSAVAGLVVLFILYILAGLAILDGDGPIE